MVQRGVEEAGEGGAGASQRARASLGEGSTRKRWRSGRSVPRPLTCPPGRKSRDRPSCQSRTRGFIVAFRTHTLLPLDDCLYALQATIPHLTRSSLHRCLQRHGIDRLPTLDLEGAKPAVRVVTVN